MNGDIASRCRGRSLFFTTDGNLMDGTNDNGRSRHNTTSVSTMDEDTSSSALALKQQADRLREEADAMQLEIEQAKQAKLDKRIMKIDGWIDQLLLLGDDDTNQTGNVEMLNTVDRVAELLRDRRFSQKQVQTMYRRLRDLRPNQCSRSRCSPLLELLVDAAGELDSVDREDNPNKRWNGRVERDLRKRLFAADYGIDLDDIEEQRNE